VSDQYLVELSQTLLMLAVFFLPLAIWGLLYE